MDDNPDSHLRQLGHRHSTPYERGPAHVCKSSPLFQKKELWVVIVHTSVWNPSADFRGPQNPSGPKCQKGLETRAIFGQCLSGTKTLRSIEC